MKLGNLLRDVTCALGTVQQKVVQEWFTRTKKMIYFIISSIFKTTYRPISVGTLIPTLSSSGYKVAPPGRFTLLAMQLLSTLFNLVLCQK